MSATFLTHFDSTSDPHIERCKIHKLTDILLLAISAVISGSEGMGESKQELASNYRLIKHG